MITRLILWLLILQLLLTPGHQQPYYWMCKINWSLSSKGRDFNYIFLKKFSTMVTRVVHTCPEAYHAHDMTMSLDSPLGLRKISTYIYIPTYHACYASLTWNKMARILHHISLCVQQDHDYITNTSYLNNNNWHSLSLILTELKAWIDNHIHMKTWGDNHIHMKTWGVIINTYRWLSARKT